MTEVTVEPLANRPFPTLLATSASVTLGALPIFLVGAMAVFIRPELGFGESALGALATLYYGASALTAFPAGRLAERLGGPKIMALAATISLIVLVGIATLARSWASLAVLLVVGGVANGTAFPASNLAFSRGFPQRRQGVGFAIKQSAGPFATLLAGAAVPLIGLTVGWRWAFALAAVATVPLIVGGRVRQWVDVANRPVVADRSRRPVWVFAVVAFFGVNATASLGAFYVESAVASGVGPGTAGTFLSIGSAAGILARMAWGGIADRRHDRHFVLLPGILFLGAVAMWTLATRPTGVTLFVLTIAVFGTGWAWPSLLNFAVLTRMAGTEGVASGIIGVGQYGGGILGPLLFGVLVEHASYRTAWTVAAGMLAVAGVWSVFGGRGLAGMESRGV